MNLQNALYANKINARVRSVRSTPLVTRYEVMTPNPRELLNKSDQLETYIGKCNVSCENGLVYIDLPKNQRQRIPILPVLEECVENEFPIGVSENADCLLDSLKKAMNILVVGAPGSGKTMFLKSLIIGLAALNSPDDLQFVLFDFKYVDFALFRDLPHLMRPVVNTYQDAFNALYHLDALMRSRYHQLMVAGCRDIEMYQNSGKKMPRIVLVIDELGDLMLSAKKDVESYIQSLAQMSRACGIHIILSTQTPRSDILSGIIKASILTTVGFKTRSALDSRVAIDSNGLEELIGNGDGIYVSSVGEKVHFQGCYVSDSEIKRTISLMIDDDFEVNEEYDLRAELNRYEDYTEVIDKSEYYQPRNTQPLQDHQQNYMYPSVYEKRLSPKDEYMLSIIKQECLSVRSAMRRFRIANGKAQELCRMAKTR